MVPRPAPQATPPPLIPQFFAGREVFITGATGFMGKVLVERLLWTCPEISKLHLLLRHKKDIPAEMRLKELQQSQIFNVIREQCPQQLEKLSVVVGDIIKPALGLSIHDVHQLSQVSIVFHSAATLKFDEPLSVAVEQNLRSVLKVMDICDQLPMLRVLVYVSTAYSNADLTYVEERVYPAPVPLHQLLALVDNLPQHLLTQITPGLISPKPNTYTFTKAMAERVLEQRARVSNYATAIFRPSIVISSMKTPFPGWIENFNGPSGAIVGAGKGVLHACDCSKDKKADVIPVDIVIDTLIAVAWEAGLENAREPRVYNCCSRDNPTSWGEFKTRLFRGVRAHPFDSPLWYPFGVITNNNRVAIKLAHWVLQVAPLYTLHFLCTTLGIKMRPNFASVCSRLRKMSDTLLFFAVREWNFSTDNVRRLRDRLTPADAAIYNLDVMTIDWDDVIEKFVQGTKRYLLQESDKNIEKARARMRVAPVCTYTPKSASSQIIIMSSVAEGSVTALYKKRAGTSGISGQLYETKLVCLVYFRLLHNKNVETFHLASNVDEIGAFDDICLKLKLKNYDRQILILVQAKHKDNDDSTLDDKNELVKWCESIMKVKEKFGSNKDDDVFKDNFNDVDCLFVVYTNAKYDFGKTVSSSIFESSYATDLNDLLSTGPVGSQPNYTDKDLEEFSETIMNEEIPILAERFEKYLNDSQSMNIMNNDYIVRYHVILGQKVVNISDIQEKRGTKCRVLSFRDDFFDTNDKYLALLRKCLYENILKNREKVKKSKELNALISSFLADPCANTLGPLIDRHIIYKNEKLEFTSKRPQSDIQQLEKMNISPDVIEKTRATTAKNILKALNLAVPIAFGNLDLAIRGNADKIEQRLNHLTKIFKELFENSKQIESYKVVTIDDTIDEGILSCNGGIGGCVGNIFIYNENKKLLKITNDQMSLDNNAKSLYLKLEADYNLDEFRFDVQTSKFPKLTLDCYNIAREFLSRLVIFSKQGNHFEVEKKFKEEKEALCKKDKRYVFRNMASDVLFIRYHNEIQKWWMSPKSGPYLTKKNSIFTKTLQDIRRERWDHMMRTSLVNIKQRHLKRILAKERQSSTTEAQNSSPDVLESTSGNNEESIASLPLEIGKSKCSDET